MAEVTLDLIKELRERTGVGMMECKKSLIEAEGDINKAIRILKEKGAITAAKKGERTIKEGIIGFYMSDDKKTVSLVEVQCETDFVAKNENFQSLAKNIAAHVSKTKASNTEELMAEKISGDETVKDLINGAIQKLGENMSIGKFMTLTSENGFFGTYLHFNQKTAVAIEIVQGVVSDKTLELANQIAMHAASDKPVAAVREAVSKEDIDEQKEIFKKQTIESGKPENMVDKIVEGKINAWFSQSVLIDQKLFSDNKISIKSILEEIGKECKKEVSFGKYTLMNIGG